MIKAAVLGFPIGHSLSPRLHGWWIKRYGIEGSYEAIETKPDDLKSTLTRLANEGYAGCNLTMPLKETVLPLLDDIDGLAQKIGAVNTVVINQGKLFGMNTDAYGFMQHLKRAAPGKSFQKTVILGAGGAARAAVTALQKAGVNNITVINRTLDRAQRMADDFDVFTCAWEKRAEALSGINLLVNTTSLGMKGKDPLDFDLNLLPQNAVVYDIVYNPLMTNLLKDASSRGNLIVEGLGMLLHQARPAFKAWFGTDPEVTFELEEEMKGYLK